MRKSLRTSIFLLILIGFVSVRAAAQTFELPDARTGDNYRVQIDQVLRDTYRLKLETGSRDATIQWSVENGDLPPGLSVRTDGVISGMLGASRDRAFAFRLRAQDANAKDDALILEFVINVKGGGLRLARFQGPTLRPLDEPVKRPEGADGRVGRKGANGEPPLAEPDPAPQGGAASATAASSGNGENGEKGNMSQSPLSSRNRRFIVGFEQAGAASAESKGQPFLDLFFTTPLPWGAGKRKLDADEAKKYPFAHFSLWGNVKLNSTPQQIAALSDVTSNAVSAITEGKVNKLTLGFEFVAGPEIRLAKAGRTHISFIGGWGAVAPLSPTQATQIFKTPDSTSSQAKRFFEKYPGAQGKQFIGFTTPERDRFLRQYFAGFRFRTYRYEDNGDLADQFPGMFDVTFGQNEAVTGGTLHKFVVGLEGFYALPFGERRFLFLFGSAKFKAGGAKTKEAPFILDTAESSVLPTDPKVFLADPTPSNRDTYRLGFGVDLIEVFKAATKKEDKPKAP